MRASEHILGVSTPGELGKREGQGLGGTWDLYLHRSLFQSLTQVVLVTMKDSFLSLDTVFPPVKPPVWTDG